MARAHFVAKARKDNPKAGIKKGDSYYWWQFKNSAKSYSKTAPRRSQLTRSGYLSAIYDLEDNVIANAVADDSLRDTIESLISDLETLRDEQQEKLDNMPDNLRENSMSGELLQERYDALDNAVSEYQDIDVDSCPQETSDLDEDEREDEESDEDFLKRMQDAYWEEKLEEFQNVSIS